MFHALLRVQVHVLLVLVQLFFWKVTFSNTCTTTTSCINSHAHAFAFLFWSTKALNLVLFHINVQFKHARTRANFLFLHYLTMKGAHLVNRTTCACACYIYIRKPNKVASIRINTYVLGQKHTCFACFMQVSHYYCLFYTVYLLVLASASTC